MDELTGRRKLDAIRSEEVAGNVADSMEYRLALVAKVKAGEISLEDAQAQLQAAKRKAKSIGKTTRSKVFRES